MGQAKRRGSYEERVQAAVIKKVEDLKALKELQQIQEQALTPQERNKRCKAKLLVAQLLAFTKAGEPL